MDELLTFLDVETPNRHNDRVCSIGIVQTDLAGRLVERRSFLVNPETDFDVVNVRINGITADDVCHAPTWPELWEAELARLVAGHRLVAHNARFDLCAMTKAFAAYGVPVGVPTYADTMDIARRKLPGLPNYRLTTLCSRLGLDTFRHHDAAEDAHACMLAYWRMVDPGEDVPFGSYVLGGGHEGGRRYRAKASAEATLDMGELVRMLSDIVSDGEVSIDEAMAALSFIASHETLSGNAAVSQVADAIQEAVSDGDLSAEEAGELESRFERLVDPAAHGDDVEIVYEGRSFVLTGDFEHGSRSEMKAFIEARGGTVAKGVSGKVSYVVVGGCGSDAYAMGSYGTKVKKALELQAKGKPVAIVRECDLF